MANIDGGAAHDCVRSILDGRQKGVFHYKDSGATQEHWFGNEGVEGGEGLRVLSQPPSGNPTLKEQSWKPTDTEVRSGIRKAISLLRPSDPASADWLQVRICSVVDTPMRDVWPGICL